MYRVFGYENVEFANTSQYIIASLLTKIFIIMKSIFSYFSQLLRLCHQSEPQYLKLYFSSRLVSSFELNVV